MSPTLAEVNIPPFNPSKLPDFHVNAPRLDDAILQLLKDAPTCLDEQQKRMLVSGAQSLRDELELWNTQISSRTELLERQDSLVSFAMQVEDMLSKVAKALRPIDRVPREILSTIFVLDQGDGYQVYPPSLGPHRLSHVCGSWRAIVLSSPNLWSKIIIDFQDAPNPFPNQHFLELDHILRLSHPAPLSIHVDNLDYRESAPANPLLLTLLAHASRWKSLEWGEFSDPRELRCLAPFNTSLTNLTTLRIYDNLYEIIESDLALPPNITHFVVAENNSIDLQIDRSKIINYTGTVNDTEMLPLLNMMTNLQHARITICEAEDEVDAMPVTFSSLVSLSVSPYEQEWHAVQATLLRHLTAPRLEKLAGEMYDEDDLKAYVVFMKQSPFITHLSLEIRFDGSGSCDLQDVLKVCPMLRSLEIGPPGHDILWSRLLEPSTLLCSLAELTLKNYHASTSLLDVLEKRLEMDPLVVARLKRLCVRVRSPHAPEVLARIDNLVAQGLFYEEYRN